MLAGGASVLSNNQFGQVIHVAERPRGSNASKARKPVTDIIDEPGFADFTVRHHIDAEFCLPVNYLVDRLAHN